MDASNEIFKLAAALINDTSQSIFLTGKAGTGKTTFLHYIKEHTIKNVIVAAPTGVAAINAGGTTIHSLFQLPFEPFLPDPSGNKKLSHHFKMHKNKINLLKELELLIIDEVSMLRADVLDAIDSSLRHFRRSLLPFGGVQMLYIGDMFQLPPVVQKEEWQLLRQYYKSPFFFHAKAIEQSFPVYIELKKIYRQKEQKFIDLLNQVRNNEISNESLNQLNSRYIPGFKIPKNKNHVILATHNYITEEVNYSELDKLSGKDVTYSGHVTGNFSESSFPTERELQLKIGAQVMFVKNDTGEQRRFYNGKLGIVKELDDDYITVELEGSKEEIGVTKETWRNIRYTLNKEKNEIEEEELGAFTQFPLRLAWAITIHKSQGLTFENAVIDAGKSFAAGQVYVALSRCTSLEGIILKSQIPASSISTDPEVITFSRREKELSELEQILRKERPKYIQERLIRTFEWRHLLGLCTSFSELISEKQIPDKDKALKLALDVKDKAYKQQEFAGKFQEQLKDIFQREQSDELAFLKERVQNAVVYFDKDISGYILNPLIEHLKELKGVAKVKQYTQSLAKIITGIENFLSRLHNASYGDISLMEGFIFERKKFQEEHPEIKDKQKKGKTEKLEKGSSHRFSLEMFKGGKSIETIAKERNLAQSTIEGHLCTFVRTGELDVQSLVSEEKIKVIRKRIENNPDNLGLSAIKEQLGDTYSYGELRAVLNHILKEKETGV